jgi:hypothetical protein
VLYDRQVLADERLARGRVQWQPAELFESMLPIARLGSQCDQAEIQGLHRNGLRVGNDPELDDLAILAVETQLEVELCGRPGRFRGRTDHVVVGHENPGSYEKARPEADRAAPGVPQPDSAHCPATERSSGQVAHTHEVVPTNESLQLRASDELIPRLRQHGRESRLTLHAVGRPRPLCRGSESQLRYPGPIGAGL